MGAAYLQGPSAIRTIRVRYWCEGKERFDSAVIAMQASSRKANRNVYFCKNCGFYHVGRNGENKRSSAKAIKELIK
jgi:hypothetical protein